MAKIKSGIRCSVTSWEGQVKECAPASPPAIELRFLRRFGSGKEVGDLSRTDRERGMWDPKDFSTTN